jgi:hypothetical protein
MNNRLLRPGKLIYWLTGLILMSACSSPANQVAMRCNEILPYIQSASAACSKVGRDQICYGSRTVDVEFNNGNHADTNSFLKPGDIAPLTSFKAVRTSRIDLEQNQVGLALFKLQAQMPNITTGQAVTFVLYGDAAFGQQTNGQPAIETTTIGSNKIGTFPGGGAFYFTTNVAANVTCNDIAPSGLIIQNQKGTQVAFSLNGAQITIGSTVLFQIDKNAQMIVSVLEGHAEVVAGGSKQVAQAGQQLSVPLSGGNTPQAANPPSTPVMVGRSLQLHSCSLARSAGVRTGCVILSAGTENTNSQGSSSQNGTQNGTGSNAGTAAQKGLQNAATRVCNVVPDEAIDKIPFLCQ